jgi:membrane-associated phospholipid phosphatase
MMAILAKLNSFPVLATLLWLILLPFVTIFDLDTSVELYNPLSEFGVFIRYLGEVPGYLVVILALSLFIIYLLRNPFKSAYITYVNLGILFFLNYGLMLTTATYLDKYFSAHNLFVFDRTTVTVIFSVIYTYTIWRIYKSDFQLSKTHLYFAALTIIVVLLYPLIVVNVITKPIWGRIRFNDLSNLNAFTAWYLPQGITGNRSFISGHVSMGVMVWALTILIRKYDQNIQKFIKLLLFLWALTVALGRIVIGAHYLSDVFFSLGIGFGIFYLVNRKIGDRYILTNLSY